MYFEDWPKPKLALVITGRLDGYLEPCGCAGLDRMKGGIGRRYSMLEDLRRKRGWPVVAVDVGGNVKGFGKQADLKFQTVAEAVKKMGYDAVALGKNELKFPVTEVGRADRRRSTARRASSSRPTSPRSSDSTRRSASSSAAA